MNKYRLISDILIDRKTGKQENIWCLGILKGSDFFLEMVYNEWGFNKNISTSDFNDKYDFKYKELRPKKNLKQMSEVFIKNTRLESKNITVPHIQTATLERDGIASISYFLFLDEPILLNTFGESVNITGILNFIIDDDVLILPLQDREEQVLKTFI